MDEKMWHIYTMEYYSAEKTNDIMKFADKWMELEKIILSEITQIQKDKHVEWEHVKGSDLQIQSYRISMTQDNRISKSSPSEGPLSIMQQKPEASDQTNDS
ncbi:hypothetical protein STEG23_029690 [Scotinomys teguina]